MHALRGRTRRALAVAGLTASALGLAGCQHGKISADQAAEKLGAYLSPGYNVQCGPASGPYWDYVCTVTPPRASKDKPYKVKVRVGPAQIVERAYCGAGRTGSPVHC